MDSEIIIRNRRYYQQRLNSVIPFCDFKNSSVLDLGCGEMLLKPIVLSKGGEYTGIDSTAYKTDPHFIQGNVLDPLVSANKQFDYIFCLGVLDHLTSSQQSILLTNFHSKFNKYFIYNVWNRNSLWHYLFLSKNDHPITAEFIKNSNTLVYFLKIPFTQLVFTLKPNKINRLLATEIIYRVEHDK